MMLMLFFFLPQEKEDNKRYSQQEGSDCSVLLWLRLCGCVLSAVTACFIKTKKRSSSTFTLPSHGLFLCTGTISMAVKARE